MKLILAGQCSLPRVHDGTGRRDYDQPSFEGFMILQVINENDETI